MSASLNLDSRVRTIDVSDIKQYLPTTYNYSDPNLPEVPVVCSRSLDLFKANLNHYNILDLKLYASQIKQYEKIEPLHKCLSIIVVAVEVALVAALILLPLTPAALVVGPIVGLACAIWGGLTSNLMEEFRTNQGQLSNLHTVLAALLGVFTLGLSVPIQYVVAAFTKKANMEKVVDKYKSIVERDLQAFKEFLEKNGTEIEARITANLAELKAVGPKNEPHRAEAYLELAKKCDYSIKEHEQALIELAAVNKFYLGK